MAEDNSAQELAPSAPDSPATSVSDATLEEARSLPADVPPEELVESEQKLFGVPMDAFVKFGTTTGAHDQWMAQQQAEAEERRRIDDEEKRIARDHGADKGNPFDVAKMHTNTFTDHPEIARAYVPLSYMSRNGKEVEYEGVGDVIMVQDPKFPDELALLLFCPKCKERLPADRCIITVRQSNRPWGLDTSKAGELCVFEGWAFRSAGVISDGELFTCPRCPWRARVDKNRVRPE